MLVISRKAGEKIRIGRDITISVLDIKNGKVSIGIEAPSSIPVKRIDITDKNTKANILEDLVQEQPKKS